MKEESGSVKERNDSPSFWVIGFLLLVVLPLLNVLPSEDSWFYISDFSLNRFGKFLAFAILALGLDLIWGYTGILSLGHGVFFGLGAYCIGMPNVSPGMECGAGTEAISAEGCIVTAGALESHVHFICPQQCWEALSAAEPDQPPAPMP